LFTPQSHHFPGIVMLLPLVAAINNDGHRLVQSHTTKNDIILATPQRNRGVALNAVATIPVQYRVGCDPFPKTHEQQY
jgi:hypothetical protein